MNIDNQQLFFVAGAFFYLVITGKLEAILKVLLGEGLKSRTKETPKQSKEGDAPPSSIA